MISKFASMRDSWFTKIILSITALSFMSLFGVSGYINSANRNKTVIKVGKVELSQSEFNFLVQRELVQLRSGNDLDDESAEKLKNEVIKVLAHAKLDDAIIQSTMNKYNIDFRPAIVGTMITNSPQFMNANGAFDYALFSEYMRRSGKSEQEISQDVKNQLGRQLLVDTQVAYANVPHVLLAQMQKVLGQRRSFNYVKISTRDAAINRQPSEEELDRIYDEFSAELSVPEKRNATVLFISDESIENSIEVSPEEIAAYYKEHIEDFEQPEKRAVLQMVFENADDAKAAKAELNNGADFASVAAKYGQKAEDIDLGLVSRNDLSDELADVIFALDQGQTSDVTEIADSWQILKVTGTQAASKMPKAEAEAQIVREIRQDKSYDSTYEVMAQIEDKLGAGESLEDIAKSFNAALQPVYNVTEEGQSDTANAALSKILQENKDVIDGIFSYNEGEITQAVEDDNGLVVARVDAVMPQHVLPREEASAQLMTYWRDTERSAVTQELVDAIETELEQGDELNAVAAKHGLKLVKTMPITRAETFADLPFEQMKELFNLPQDEAKVLQNGEDYIVASTVNIYNDANAMSDADKNFLLRALRAQSARDMSEALLKDYASEFEVEVNYNRMGMNDE